MSWKIINHILGLAAVDKTFAQELLEDPLGAVRAKGLQLTPEEEKVFSTISAKDLREFSQQLMQRLDRSQSDQE
jgi:hypothetical protein